MGNKIFRAAALICITILLQQSAQAAFFNGLTAERLLDAAGGSPQPLAIAPDEYESDDSKAEAKWVNLNGPTRSYNFHEDPDEDWVAFYAENGEVITVDTINLGAIADTHIFLYRNDGATLISDNDDRGAGDLSSYVVWTVDADAIYYVKVTSSALASSPFSGEGATYDLRVWNETGPESFPASLTVVLQNTSGGAVYGGSVSFTQTSPQYITHPTMLLGSTNAYTYEWSLGAGGTVLYQLQGSKSPDYLPSGLESGSVLAGQNKTVILQLDALPSLGVSPISDTVDEAAGTHDFAITNEGGGTLNWQAQVTAGGTWASITSATSGSCAATLSVSVSGNASASTRQATIEVTATGADNSPATITIDQEADTAAPVVTLSGPNPAYIGEGDSYADPGATANDNVDGDVTPAVTKSYDDVDAGIAGTYSITWSATDTAGNTGSATRTVIVRAQQSVPVPLDWRIVFAVLLLCTVLILRQRGRC